MTRATVKRAVYGMELLQEAQRHRDERANTGAEAEGNGNNDP